MLHLLKFWKLSLIELIQGSWHIHCLDDSGSLEWTSVERWGLFDHILLKAEAFLSSFLWLNLFSFLVISNLFPLIYFQPWGIFFFFFQERKRIKINHTIRQQKKKNHLTTIVIAYSVLLSSPYPYSIKIKNPIL